MSDTPTTQENTMPRTPEEQRFAIQCLAVASAMGSIDLTPDQTVTRAEAYLAFVTGVQVQSPRERIVEALDAANVT